MEYREMTVREAEKEGIFVSMAPDPELDPEEILEIYEDGSIFIQCSGGCINDATL